jgi:Inner membrane component of T3SS, cytoplasmic domain
MSQQPTGRPAKLHISAEDLDTPEVGARIDQLRAAQAAPLVRPVGATVPQTGRGSWWRGNVPTLALVGFGGGLVGWLGAELIARPDSEDPWYGNSVNVGTILFVGVFAVALGFALGLWDGIQARSRRKMLLAARRLAPFMLGASVAGGFVAQQVFTGMLEAAYRRALDDNSVEAFQSSLHLARGVAFAIAAGSLGLALGGASRSGRRAVNAAIGGVVGGFVGGFLFDYVGEWLDADSGTVPRLVALSLCGAMVGVGIGLVEAVRKEHWLEIASGGMAGKQFILYQDRTTVGAAPDVDITLIKDPAIAPHHLTLQRTPRGLVVTSVEADRPVLVNGVPIREAVLADGHSLQAGRTVLRYREKAPSAPVTGTIH